MVGALRADDGQLTQELGQALFGDLLRPRLQRRRCRGRGVHARNSSGRTADRRAPAPLARAAHDRCRARVHHPARTLVLEPAVLLLAVLERLAPESLMVNAGS